MLQNPAVKRWLDGIEPAWTMLDQKSFTALRRPSLPPAGAIRLAADLSPDELGQSAVTRNALILLDSAEQGSETQSYTKPVVFLIGNNAAISRRDRTMVNSTLTKLLGFFFVGEITICADAEEIDQDCNHVPCDHGSRSDQQTIVNPQDLKGTDDCRHPWVHTRA